MHNLKKIQTIIKILEKEKEQFKHELSLINFEMNKKESLVQKMQEYLNEYMSEEKFGLDKKIPMFNINMGLFTNQIKTVIVKTESEIVSCKINSEVVFSKIKMIDQKISLVKSYEEKARTNIVFAENLYEQTMLDDIYSVHITRSYHE